MTALAEAAETLRLGGGIGFDFSTLRPKGELTRSLDSSALGSVSFMQLFHALCNTVSSSRCRLGAQMEALRVVHPDIPRIVRAMYNIIDCAK